MTQQDIIDELRSYEPPEVMYVEYQPQPEEVYVDWWMPEDYSQWDLEDILDEFADRFNLPRISTPEIRRSTTPGVVVFVFTVLLPY